MCSGRAEPVRSVFVAAQPGSASAGAAHAMTGALAQRVAAKLRQSGSVRIVGSEAQADAVLHVEGFFWATGSVSLNPRSQSGSFTNYQGYASAELTSPSRQVLWSYLATPRRFKMNGVVDNLAREISDNLIATLKQGLAASPSVAPANAAPGTALRAAGATFPAPLYQKWFQSFTAQTGGVAISYDPVGSVEGLAQLAAGKVEIAASDIPTPAESEAGLLRFPSVAGGIVPIFNLAGLAQELGLTGEVLAEIYSGKITRWNDPRIRALNGTVRLPNAPIAVVHRSDGSGTTFVWTSYLALSNPDWTGRTGASIEWPTGVGAMGNDGVAEAVRKTPNSIGYVEMTFAIQHHLAFASVRNPAGHMVRANLDSISAAAQGFHTMGPREGPTFNSPGLILNSRETDSYPIATFTWLVISASDPASHADPQSAQQSSAFCSGCWWMGSANALRSGTPRFHTISSGKSSARSMP